MIDDDFDKIDDDDFAGEFDFVEDDKSSGNPNNNSDPGSNKPSAGGPIKGLIYLAILGTLGYYGYKYFTAPSTPEENVTTTTLPAPVEDTSSNDAAINFSDTANPVPQDQLADALPQAKNFAEVQKDLKAATVANQNANGLIPAEINATLDSISEEMTLNVNQIKQLESTITNLADTLEQLNKSISAMDNRVLSLTETVDALSQDLTNVKKIMVDEDIDLTSPTSLKFSNKNRIAPLNTKAADYSVHAIIPGRAWLKSANGPIITVTEGDKVGDYGTVAVIDATNGLVRTSSGIIFR